MSDAKLIEEAKKSIDDKDAYESPVYTTQLMARLATALATSTAREKSWHDHILAASGGHATTPEGAREFINSLRDMLDVAKGETNATKAQLLKFAELIRDADHVSRERFEYYRLCDQLDNNGKPYPSQFCADMVVQAAGILKAAALATGSEAGK